MSSITLDLLISFLLVVAAAGVVGVGLSVLWQQWRVQRAAGSSAGPAHWSNDEYAERLRKAYFSKERRARALRERERRFRQAEAAVADAPDAPGASGDGQATDVPPPPDQREAYYGAVLELEGEISETTVRQAYLRLMAAYHPDKVAGLGIKLQQLAEEETKAITEAYTFFRKRYGF